MKKAKTILLISAFLLTFILTKEVNVMQDTQEIWKDVVGYEGLYQVSSLGRVKSLPRNGTTNNCKILATQPAKGYHSLKLSKNDVVKRYTIHRLMGFAFMIDTYFDGAQINHKNGVRTDNCIQNLEWVTPQENTIHAHRLGLCKSPKYWLGKKGANNRTSIPVIQYDKNMNFIKEYVSATFASIEGGYNRQNISQCCSSTRKYANGFIWRHKKT